MMHLGDMARALPPGKLPDLTFGIEVECLTVFRRAIFEKYESIHEALEKIYRSRSLPIQHAHAAKSGIDYEKWTLTTDPSIGSLLTEEPTLLKLLPQGTTWLEIAEEWSDTPTELVSRKLTAPALPTSNSKASIKSIIEDNSCFREIDMYLDILRQGLDHASYPLPTCGLHIHIGSPTGEAFSLGMYHQLAWLTTIFEPLISTLHHYRRVPHWSNQPAVYCQTNRTAFQLNNHTCTQHGRMVDDTEIERMIFRTKDLAELVELMSVDCPFTDFVPENHNPPQPAVPSDEPPWDPHDLGPYNQNVDWNAELAPHPDEPPSGDTGSVLSFVQGNDGTTPGWKYRIVRWNLLLRTDGGPCTIEFRQPAGTTDATEISMTVALYISLFRAAQERARMVQNGHKVPTTKLHVSLEGLLSVLDLPESIKDYWRGRAWEMQSERDELGAQMQYPGEPHKECVVCDDARSKMMRPSTPTTWFCMPHPDARS